MMSSIELILKEHGNVDPTEVPVRFTKISPDAYTLEVFSYVLTPEGNEFLRIQSELLLKLLDAAERLGIGFAVPFYESLTISEP